MQGDALRIDEALIEGQPGPVKTVASNAFVYVPPELHVELTTWLETLKGDPQDWMFQPTHGRRGQMNANNYRERVLLPAAQKAGVKG